MGSGETESSRRGKLSEDMGECAVLVLCTILMDFRDYHNNTKKPQEKKKKKNFNDTTMKTSVGSGFLRDKNMLQRVGRI